MCFHLCIVIVVALDEGDIALLKTYVSSFRHNHHMHFRVRHPTMMRLKNAKKI